MRYNRNINNAYPGMRRREGNDIKRIKAGIFGCGRGLTLMKNIMACNGEIAALCDQDPVRRNEAVKALGGSAPKGVYERFDDFISHTGLQAVVLADHFHEHAALAVRCLQKNILFDRRFLCIYIFLHFRYTVPVIHIRDIPPILPPSVGRYQYERRRIHPSAPSGI